MLASWLRYPKKHYSSTVDLFLYTWIIVLMQITKRNLEHAIRDHIFFFFNPCFIFQSCHDEEEDGEEVKSFEVGVQVSRSDCPSR